MFNFLLINFHIYCFCQNKFYFHFGLQDSGSRSSSVSRLSHYLDLASETNKPKTKPREQKQDSDIVQSVELEMNFEMRGDFYFSYNLFLLRKYLLLLYIQYFV